jgi:hypothetical protein
MAVRPIWRAKNMMTGVNLIHVPYRGEASAMNDLLGGQVPHRSASRSISTWRFSCLRQVSTASWPAACAATTTPSAPISRALIDMPADVAIAENEIRVRFHRRAHRKGVFPNTIEDALKVIDGLGQCTSTQDKDPTFRQRERTDSGEHRSRPGTRISDGHLPHSPQHLCGHFHEHSGRGPLGVHRADELG